MGDDPILPISDEQAKLGQELIGAARDIGGYAADVLADLPKDLVGLLGDKVKAFRARRWAEHWDRVKKRLEQQGIKSPEPPPLKLALPMLAAIADEPDETLKDIWARLFAASMNPDRSRLVRKRFIDAVKLLEPLDAAVLQWAHEHGDAIQADQRNEAANAFGVERDQLDISLESLSSAEFMSRHGSLFAATAFGREFLRSVAD